MRVKQQILLLNQQIATGLSQGQQFVATPEFR
jgi:hypothetical protein